MLYYIRMTIKEVLTKEGKKILARFADVSKISLQICCKIRTLQFFWVIAFIWPVNNVHSFVRLKLKTGNFLRWIDQRS